MELIFSIDNQIMKRIDSETIVNHSKNVDATFTFNEVWNDLEKFVIFKDDKGHIVREYLGRIGATYTIQVPFSVLKGRYFSVSVYAGDLLTTNTVIVYLVNSGYVKHHNPHDKHHHNPHHPHNHPPHGGMCDEKDIFVSIYEEIHDCFNSINFCGNNLNFYHDQELLYSVSLPFADEVTVRSWMAEADIKNTAIHEALALKADKEHTHSSTDITDLDNSMEGSIDNLLDTLTDAIEDL